MIIDDGFVYFDFVRVMESVKVHFMAFVASVSRALVVIKSNF